MKMGRFQDGMDDRALSRAVVTVYQQIKSDGGKPAAEQWTLYDHPKAKEMIRMVRRQYKSATGVPSVVRAYVIAQKYMDFRKATAADKLEIIADLDIPTDLVEIA